MMRPLNHITVEGMNCPVSRIVSFGAAGSSTHQNVGATALGTPGICGMKTIARAYMWWPKLDQEIEKAVRVCTIYQNIRNSPFSAPLTTEKKQSTDLIWFLLLMVYPRRWCLTTALTLHQLILLNWHASMALSIYWFHLTTLNPVRQPRGLCELLKMLWLNRCLKVQRAFLWNRLANFLFRYRITPNQRLWSLWMSANPFQLIKYCRARIVIGLTFVRQEWSFLIMFIL